MKIYCTTALSDEYKIIKSEDSAVGRTFALHKSQPRFNPRNLWSPVPHSSDSTIEYGLKPK